MLRYLPCTELPEQYFQLFGSEGLEPGRVKKTRPTVLGRLTCLLLADFVPSAPIGGTDPRGPSGATAPEALPPLMLRSRSSVASVALRIRSGDQKEVACAAVSEAWELTTSLGAVPASAPVVVAPITPA